MSADFRGVNRYNYDLSQSIATLQRHFENMDDESLVRCLETHGVFEELFRSFRKPNNRQAILRFVRRMFRVDAVSEHLLDREYRLRLSATPSVRVAVDPTNPAYSPAEGWSDYSPTARWLEPHDGDAFRYMAGLNREVRQEISVEAMDRAREIMDLQSELARRREDEAQAWRRRMLGDWRSDE